MESFNLKTLVFLYQRFSSMVQDGNSSLDRQGDAQKDWLARHPECEVVDEIFIDKGVSGYSGKHLEQGSLGQLVAAIESGAVPSGSIILVEHFSRLTRMSIHESGKLVDKIWDHNITIVTARDGTIYSPKKKEDLATRMRLLVEIDKAHSDSQYRSDKAKGAWAARKKKAIEENIAPRMRMPFWLNPDGTLNEFKGIVENLFRLYLEGYGQVRLERELRKLYPGAEPLENFNPPKMIRIIQNRKCIGEVYGKKLYEPAVDEETFYKAQEIHQNKLFESVKKDRRWPLSGLVQCGHCGSGMSIQQSKESLPLLRCSNKRRSGGENCDAPSTFPYIVADHFFALYVEKHMLSMLCKRKMNEKDTIRLAEIDDSLRKRSIALIQLDKLFDDMLGEGNDVSVVVEKQQRLKNEINELNDEKLNLNGRLKAQKSFFVNSDAMKLTSNSDDYNLELLKLGVKIVITNKTISFTPDNSTNAVATLEYLKCKRVDGEARYIYRISENVDWLPQVKTTSFVSSEGVTVDSLLNRPPMTESSKTLQNAIWKTMDKINELQEQGKGANIAELLGNKLDDFYTNHTKPATL